CGWWYSAPLPDGRLVVAHMTDADLRPRSASSADDSWENRLSRTTLTRARVGSQALIDKPKNVCAASRLRRPMYGADWLAAGDAAMAFDPLSGQGILKALVGGMRAAEAVIGHFNGNPRSIAEYAEWMTMQFSSYLKTRKLFYMKEQRWPDA